MDIGQSWYANEVQKGEELQGCAFVHLVVHLCLSHCNWFATILHDVKQNKNLSLRVNVCHVSKKALLSSRRWSRQQRGLTRHGRRRRSRQGEKATEKTGDFPQSRHQHHAGMALPASHSKSLFLFVSSYMSISAEISHWTLTRENYYTVRSGPKIWLDDERMPTALGLFIFVSLRLTVLQKSII